MSLHKFHPAVNTWFEKSFAAPTPAQLEAWPAIKSGAHALIAAPTGSGKTLAAFLAAIDELVWQALEGDLFGQLPEETYIVYVSPLKALSNDIQKNLEIPLQGIRAELRESGLADVPLRTMVRTGDTPQKERVQMRRKPPHILVTTPESLYILLTSESGRRVLSTTRTLIVDEIHALAGNKRGAHLSLSAERLESLCARPLIRIGLSATQKPIETMVHFLMGAREDQCTIIDSGHHRERDLGLEITGSPLQAVMSAEAWSEVYQRLSELIEAHRTTLIFVNTRRLAERLAKALAERLGEQAVTSHHGSLAREHRLFAEQRLKQGQLKALVATASLELGIDIGDVNLVCQLGSPRAINALLQRVGRSGHGVGAIPKGRLFPASRDDLMECVALLNAVDEGELDRLIVPEHPFDVLAQQIVAEVSGAEWREDELYALIIKAWPYRNLSREAFNAIVNMLAQGFATRRGRRSAWLHYDAVNKRLRARRGAQLNALLNGGAIPDMFDFDVILQPEGFLVGTLNEDFAFESLPGDIFQLGNTSYRILKTEGGKVHVEDAHGQPPNIPFWFGEAPGRTNELSLAVSGLRAVIDEKLTAGMMHTQSFVERELGLSARVASELTEYLAATQAALGVLPTQDVIVFERFFDEAGDQHLVIHSPFGSRLNRAWGLALRKRFCRKFNFELQAAALEDTIVLSLGSTHSFPLQEVAGYLNSKTVQDLLIQALLDAPMFATHWRWNASIALAVRRNRNGKRVPPQFQRMDAEDLMAVVFPDQLACLENIVGQREIPDHPLVEQTIWDCLHEVMDVEGLITLLGRIEQGEVKVVCCDLTGPSPLAQEILAARPYAFLDDAPAEERRTQMVQARRFTAPEDAVQLGTLKPQAIAQVRAEAWPVMNNADELHDALMLLGCLTPYDREQIPKQRWQAMIDRLVDEKRATCIELPNKEQRWVCAERLAQWQVLYLEIRLDPAIDAVGTADPWTRETALVELVRGRLEGSGPITVATLSDVIGMPVKEIDTALLALETEGFAMQGRFTPNASQVEWCERGLLARIHRYTMKDLRREIQPVSRALYMRFLFHWQGLVEQAGPPQGFDTKGGAEALVRILKQLEGFQIPAQSWETDILPARLQGYQQEWLDYACATGRVVWLRLNRPARSAQRGPSMTGPVRNTPIMLISRRHRRFWQTPAVGQSPVLSSVAQKILDHLERNGASFFDDIMAYSSLLRTQVEQGLGELAALGLVNSDSYAGLRALLKSNHHHRKGRRSRRGLPLTEDLETAGRWSRVSEEPIPKHTSSAHGIRDDDALRHIAHILLLRYGIVFRSVLERESDLPQWRDLLYNYRRMEARGEVRGGRFVDSFSGEQFALPEAVGLLRKIKRQSLSNELVIVSAADPLNLVGVVLPGKRVPAMGGNRVLYRDGHAIALLVSGKIKLLIDLDVKTQWLINNLLLRKVFPDPTKLSDVVYAQNR